MGSNDERRSEHVEHERRRTIMADVAWLARLVRGSSWPGEMAEQVERAAERVIRAAEHDQQAQAWTLTLAQVVDEQAEDEGLWFNAQTMPEAYLQQELRRLHRIIEMGQSGRRPNDA